MALRAMRAGKDVMVDKPGCTTEAQLAELRGCRPRPGASSRSAIPSTTCSPRPSPPPAWSPRARSAGWSSTIGLGPHRVGCTPGPTGSGIPRSGGDILVDIASHQFEQFLHFTGSTSARILHPVEANFDHPDRAPLERLRPRHRRLRPRHRLHPRRLDDARRARRSGATAGSSSSAPRAPSSSASTSTSRAARAATISSSSTPRARATSIAPARTSTYGEQLRDDVLNRTETAMPQDHCFLRDGARPRGAPRSPPRSPGAARHDAGSRSASSARASAPRTSRPTPRSPTSTRSPPSATSTPPAAPRSPRSSASPPPSTGLDDLLDARPRHRRHLHPLGPAPGPGDRRARGRLPRRRREAGGEEPRRDRRRRRRRGGLRQARLPDLPVPLRPRHPEARTT